MFGKFLLIFYLLISCSIINIQSKIEYSKIVDKFLINLSDSNNNLIFLDDSVTDTSGNRESGRSKSDQKLINFILGMMVQIPQYTDYSILLAALIDQHDKPECATQKFKESFDSNKITHETIQMARQQETDKLIQDLLSDLGNTEEIRNIDWTNPRKACYEVMSLHEEKYEEIKENLDKSVGLSEFVLKVYTNGETFEEFYSKKGNGITKIFHRERNKLMNFILKINFDGDLEKMKTVYKDYKKWRQDLEQLYMILKESEEASRKIQENLLKNREGLPNCDILPYNNEIQHEFTNFIGYFLGGIMVLKQIAVCLGIDTMIFVYLIGIGVTQIIKLIALIFGLVFARIIQFALILAQIGYYLYKGKTTDEETHLKIKYRYYGNSAGAMFNLLCALIGI